MVREIEFSRMTIRLTEELDTKGKGGKEDHVIAKLSGNTIDTLRRCLVRIKCHVTFRPESLIKS
jgi:hypothetical protein